MDTEPIYPDRSTIPVTFPMMDLDNDGELQFEEWAWNIFYYRHVKVLKSNKLAFGTVNLSHIAEAHHISLRHLGTVTSYTEMVIFMAFAYLDITCSGTLAMNEIHDARCTRCPRCLASAASTDRMACPLPPLV